MNEAVTDIIVARSRDADRLSKMVAWSFAAHLAIVAVIWMLPEPAVEPPPQVMMISLGGAPGPRTGGLTQMGGREVQAPAPEEPLRRAESAPAPKPPPMALPDPKSKPAPKPERAPKEAAAKTPSTGPEPREGSARAETQVRGQGFGLSTGGGSGGGLRIDGDFCCPEYAAQVFNMIRDNWRRDTGLVGVTTFRFTVTRDGRLTDIQLERSSGFTQLDLQAERALLNIRRLPPLPSAYPYSTLTAHLDFDTGG
jgi:TonB family protein